jgi:hypothetical protein
MLLGEQIIHPSILLCYLGPPNASTSQASGGAKASKKSGGQKKPLEVAGSAQPPSRFSFLIHKKIVQKVYMFVLLHEVLNVL